MFDLHDDPGLLIGRREVLLLGHSAVPLPSTWAVAANTPRRVLAGADAGTRLVSGVNCGNDDGCGREIEDGLDHVRIVRSHADEWSRLGPAQRHHVAESGADRAARAPCQST